MSTASDHSAMVLGPPQSGYLRVATVQIDSLPARDDALGELLFPLGTPHAADPENHVWPAVQDRYQDLWSRVEKRYVDYQRSRLRCVLQACRNARAHAAVLPEYSVPWQSLTELADASRDLDIVIVAGTHLVTPIALDSGTYEELGVEKPTLNTAVCPILHQGRIVQLTPKLHRSKWEQDLACGTTWEPVHLPEPVGTFGVLVCLDFIYNDSPEWNDLVSEKLAECRWVAVPSWTPASSAANEFRSHACEQSRRYKRPVVHANQAHQGGSCIYADGEDTDDQPDPLPEDGEAMLIVDIDVNKRAPGKRTPYAARRAVHVVSQPTLVYPVETREYAAWLEGWTAELDRDGDEAERLSALADWLGHHPPNLTAARTKLQHFRLGKLLQEKGRWRSTEALKRLTCEAVTDGPVLSFEAFAAAIASGCAEEIESWRGLLDDESRSRAVALADRLRLRAERAKARLLPSAQHVFDQVAHAVRGQSAGAQAAPLLQLALKSSDQELNEAQELLAVGDYEAAKQRLDALVHHLRGALEASPGDPDLSKRLTRAQLGTAVAALNLGDTATARRQAGELEPTTMDLSQQMLLAELFACLGEGEQARATLPSPEACPADEARRRRMAIEQTIDILEGRSLTGGAASDLVSVRWAATLLERGDLPACASAVMHVAENAEGSIERFFAVNVLQQCLLQSTEDSALGPVTPIPEAARERLVRVLETAYAHLSESALAGTLRRQLDDLECVFRRLVLDIDWLEARAPAGDEISRALDQAKKLARTGDIDAAFAALPQADHPWDGELLRARLIEVAGDLAAATDRIDALRRQFPRRARIEHAFSELCMKQGRTDDALEAAGTAVHALPGVGQRLHLAGFLASRKRYEAALEALAPFSNDSRPRVLLTRAHILDELGHAQEAERSYGRYLEQRPDDGRVRMLLARHLYAQKRRRQAADEAWMAFKESAELLPLEDLWFVGEVQGERGSLEPEEVSRIQAVLRNLERRRDAEPNAESVRVSLLLRLGRTEELEETSPPDFDLLEQIGAVQRFSVDEIVPILQQQHQLGEAAFAAYRTGQTSLLAVLDITNQRLAEYIVRGSAGGGAPVERFSPTFDTQQRPAVDLNGADLVVTRLELTLLVHLKLLDDLREALGEAGRLVLPRVDREAIIRDAHELSNRASPPARSARIAIAISNVANADSTHRETRCSWGDETRELGLADLAHLLEGLGLLAPEQTRSIAGDASPTSEYPAQLGSPTGICLGLEAILKLDESEYLGKTIQRLLTVGVDVSLSPEVRIWIERERQEEALSAVSRDLANEVHARLAEGLDNRWLVLSELPEAEDLPSTRANTNPTFRQLFAKPLERAIGIARLLLRRENRQRLNADFFAAVAPAGRDAVRGFAWRDRDHYSAVAKELRRATERDLHLPALVRQIVNDPQRRRSVLEDLAELGFPDAIDADGLLDLAERLDGGLSAARARYLLDRLEWIAREPTHVGCSLGVLHVGFLYADAIFRAFCGSGDTTPRPWSNDKKDEVAHSLLSRLERISSQSARDILVTAFERLALTALTVPTASVSPAGHGRRYALDPESHGARMWGAVWAWAESSWGRRAAYSRALRSAWLWVDDAARHGRSRKLDVALLWHALTPITRNQSTQDFFTAPPLEALAILSSCWEPATNALREQIFGWSASEGPEWESDVELSAEDVLQRGALALARPSEIAGDSVRIQFPLRDREGQLLARITVAVEALVLRTQDDNVLRRAATHWKRLQGVHDGLAYQRMEELAADPTNPEPRRALARHAVSSLWRHVREDPAHLLQWPDSFQVAGNAVDKLSELCAVLSEPAVDLPEGSDVWSILMDRFDNGVWKHRADSVKLMLLAGALPGTTAMGPVRSLAETDDLDDRVLTAFDRLKDHEEQPVGQLAIDILLLRLAAARREVYTARGREMALARELPAALARLLDDLDAPSRDMQASSIEPAADGDAQAAIRDLPRSTLNLASAEGALLRVCLSTIERIGSTLSVRTRLWLGWRLYGWLAVQLDSMRREKRLDALNRLVRAAPKPVKQRRDPLDPFGYDAKHYNHRLAAVLHALGVGAVLAERESASPNGATPVWSSEVLEDILIRIADRFADSGPESDLLDWNAPPNVPDLAVWVLLTMNAQAFSRLAAETRRRTISRVPDRQTKASPEQVMFSTAVLSGATVAVSSMDQVERRELEEKMRSLEETPQTRRWRWTTFTALYTAGEAHLKQQVESLLIEHISLDDGHGDPAGMLALFLAKEAPEQIPDCIARIKSVLTDRGASALPLVLGLAQLSVHGSPEHKKAARQHLTELAKQEPFRSEPAVSELLHALGLEEERGT